MVGLYVGNLLLIGGTLFIGEWLFGSIGWGVLHGVLLGLGLIVGLSLVLFGAPGRVVTTTWLVSALAAATLAVLLGSDVLHRLAHAGADAVNAAVEPDLQPFWAPAVVSAAGGAVLLGVALAAAGARAGIGGVLAGLLGGAIVGALLGMLLAGSHWTWRGAAAVGVTFGAILWPVLQGLAARKAGIDPKTRFTRLWPSQTWETTLETKEWLEKEWQKRRERLAKRS
ncbi:MAG TPA: hypothetical protein VFK38_01005 [Candidatus Limnocylindrales bacterium]|nr:hypothetical protein [Candidatus Limnocylindrales bacterium]